MSFSKYNFYSNSIIILFFRKSNTLLITENMDPDVRAEVEKVNSMSAEDIAFSNLALQNLSKNYGSLLAVNRLCVGVNE